MNRPCMSPFLRRLVLLAAVVGPAVALGIPPSASTLPATDIAPTRVTLNGLGYPNGESTTGWFRYASTEPPGCDDTFGIRVPQNGGVNLGAGVTLLRMGQNITGLQPETTYWYCAIAENAQGKRFGELVSFTTLRALPTVTTVGAVDVGPDQAMAVGTVLTLETEATAWIRYGTTHPGTCDDAFGTREPQSGGTLILEGPQPRTFTQRFTGLMPGTTYYFCAVAQNAEGMAFGEVRQVDTLAPATVTTLPASEVSDAGAVLNGSANPNGIPATGWFRFAATELSGCNDSFGTKVPVSEPIPLGEGTTVTAFSQPLTDLQPGTTYWYCAIAQNAAGTSFGELVAFQPTAQPPTVVTEPATMVGTRSAMLNGSINPNRTETRGWFRYDTVEPGGCNDTFGTRVLGEGVPLGDGASNVGMSVMLEGLEPARTYYYCALAGNLGGGAAGEVVSFSTCTEPPTAKTLPAQVLADGTVQLHALGSGLGLRADAWFRYDLYAPQSCNDTFGAKVPLLPRDLGDGHDEQAFTEAVEGLLPGTYHYCPIVQTSAGIAYGAVESFTIAVPDVSGETGCGCSAASPGGGMLAVMFALVALGMGARRRRTAA